MLLSEALGLPGSGIVSCVGAGGKTSLLQSLCGEYLERAKPFLLTSTTRMFLRQVEQLNPVFSQSYEQGVERVRTLMTVNGFAAWFMSLDGDKVLGLPPHWVDRIGESGSFVCTLVEADGAKERLIKAPGYHEPCVPKTTMVTLGVLNLNALGQPLSEQTAHRLENVLDLLGKADGDIVRVRDLAVLAGSNRGIFKGCQSNRVLVISGGTGESLGVWRELAGYVKEFDEVGVSRIVLTRGFGSHMKPLAVKEV